MREETDMSCKNSEQAKVKFAERLKELRSEKGITQVQIAAAIGVSKGLISLWENELREPTLSNLIALADFYDVSLDFLAGRTQD